MNFAGERAMQLEPGSIDAGYGLDFDFRNIPRPWPGA
jgi:hypothetical protein